jgi:PAS domain S-box-containing protein
MNAVSLAAVALEREQEERALRESEGKFRAVFQQAAVGVAVLETATGRFLDVNQRMCEISGLTREDMLKTNFMALTLPEDLGGDLDQMKRLVAGEIPNFTMEKRNIRGDGQICWVNLTVSPLWQPGEPPLRYVAVLQDITGSKLAEAKYRRQLEYNRALVANTSAYMVSLDSKGRFVHVNEAFLKGAGYALEEVLNRRPWEIGLMNKEDAMRSKERFGVVLSGDESPPIELRLKTRGGSWRVVEVRSAMTRTPDGKPDRIIVTGTDLTERNRLQQEVLNVVEREQARLGHDLHDGVGQTMTGVVALIDALEEGLNGEAKKDAARIR